MQPDVMDLRDAAPLLGVHPNTVYRWAQRDDKPAFFIRVGQRWKVSRPLLERYLGGDDA